MAGKYRTQIPRPPTRKRKPSVRPLTPRPKGEDERTAVRRLAAMKYRLAGATYRWGYGEAAHGYKYFLTAPRSAVAPAE